MRTLICGGRNWSRDNETFRYLDWLHRRNPISVVIEGGATGADRIARRWASERNVETISFPADWKAYGKAAGPLRNQQMIDEGNPDLVIAFPGERGTADMVRRAEAAGIETVRYPPNTRN